MGTNLNPDPPMWQKFKEQIPAVLITAALVIAAAFFMVRSIAEKQQAELAPLRIQNESLAAHAEKIDRAGYGLVALSRDTCGSHARYAAKKGIGYVLVSDPDDRFARAADAIVEKSMYGRSFTGPARAAFVLARDGTVLAVVPKVDTADHAAQLLQVIAGLNP